MFRHKKVSSPSTGETHFDRRYLIDTRWGGVMLHWLRRPDHDRDMHDHPYSFWSFVLRGWYQEIVPNQKPPVTFQTDGFTIHPGYLTRTIRWFNRKKASRRDPHRISYVAPGALTLVFFGPRRRDWGFHTADRGWVPQREYRGVAVDYAEECFDNPDSRYLVFHRTLMRSMSEDWQAQFFNMLQEYYEHWSTHVPDGGYRVIARGADGYAIPDPVPTEGKLPRFD